MDQIKTLVFCEGLDLAKWTDLAATAITDQIHVVGTVYDMNEAALQVGLLQPELLLLSANMASDSVISMLEQVQESASSASSSFIFSESECIWITKCKNVSGRLLTTFKVDRKKPQENLSESAVEGSKEEYLSTPVIQKIGLPNRNGVRYIPTNQIISLEADGSYTKVHTTSNEVILACRVLKDFESVLNMTLFIRVHRAYIVNLEYVDAFNKASGGVLVMRNEMEVPLSRKEKTRISQLIHSRIKSV